MNSIANTLRVNLMLNSCLFCSSFYKTETDDVYEDFYGDKHLFDFSDYLENSKFFDPVNTNVIGKMKDEFKRKNN